MHSHRLRAQRSRYATVDAISLRQWKQFVASRIPRNERSGVPVGSVGAYTGGGGGSKLNVSIIRSAVKRKSRFRNEIINGSVSLNWRGAKSICWNYLLRYRNYPLPSPPRAAPFRSVRRAAAGGGEGGTRGRLGIFVIHSIFILLMKTSRGKSLKNSVQKWRTQPRDIKERRKGGGGGAGGEKSITADFIVLPRQFEKINFPAPLCTCTTSCPPPPGLHRSRDRPAGRLGASFWVPPLSFRRRDLSTRRTAIPGYPFNHTRVVQRHFSYTRGRGGSATLPLSPSIRFWGNALLSPD